MTKPRVRPLRAHRDLIPYGFEIKRPDGWVLSVVCDHFSDDDLAWDAAMHWFNGGPSPYPRPTAWADASG